MRRFLIFAALSALVALGACSISQSSANRGNSEGVGTGVGMPSGAPSRSPVKSEADISTDQPHAPTTR